MVKEATKLNSELRELKTVLRLLKGELSNVRVKRHGVDRGHGVYGCGVDEGWWVTTCT